MGRKIINHFKGGNILTQLDFNKRITDLSEIDMKSGVGKIAFAAVSLLSMHNEGEVWLSPNEVIKELNRFFDSVSMDGSESLNVSEEVYLKLMRINVAT